MSFWRGGATRTFKYPMNLLILVANARLVTAEEEGATGGASEVFLHQKHDLPQAWLEKSVVASDLETAVSFSVLGADVVVAASDLSLARWAVAQVSALRYLDGQLKKHIFNFFVNIWKRKFLKLELIEK